MRAFLVAGEASGDKLGAALMAGLRSETAGDVDFRGIGGERMEGEGLHTLFPLSEINFMGIGEILRNYFALKARIRQTAEAVIAMAPDVLITIDIPEFSLRVAKIVRARAPGIRIVHYVAPTVWAWRPGRADHMARFVDHVLALLPFEPPYMEAAGMRCDFVGHPVVTDPVASPAQLAAFRAQHGLGEQVLCVLPGSRRGEITRLAPIFGESVAQFAATRPETQVILPVAPQRGALLREAVGDWAVPPILLEGLTAIEKSAAFQASRLALAASGTVSLELAAARCPMVIAYDMPWLSRHIIGRMLRVDTVTLVNLVSDTRVIPEFIGGKCRPDSISGALDNVADSHSQQLAAMEATMQALGENGEQPGIRAAKAVLDGLR